MPNETIERNGAAVSTTAPATGNTEALVDHDAAAPQAGGGSKPVSNQPITRRKKLMIGVLGAAVIAIVAFGVPRIRFALSTVSTDDAYVNGHVTFVAPRVHGQVARVLVDDNNRVHKGDLLVELDKEPFRDAVAVKKAAVDTAEADLQAAKASVRGIEAQAWSRRWQLQLAVENVENQAAQLHARIAALKKAQATVVLAQQEFDRTSKLVVSDTASLLTTSTKSHRIKESFEFSALPEDAMREISERIATRVRFNAVVETGVPGFIPRAAAG
jgi:membrane fusion protein, multidrug efflux system